MYGHEVEIEVDLSGRPPLGGKLGEAVDGDGLLLSPSTCPFTTAFLINDQ